MRPIPIGISLMLMKINYTLNEEEKFMYYHYKLGIILLLLSSLISCGESEEDQQDKLASPSENGSSAPPSENSSSAPAPENNTSAPAPANSTSAPAPANSTSAPAPAKELVSDEIIADESATFATSKTVNYSALNETELNITLFITSNNGIDLARYYIKAGEFIDITIQLDIAATEIGMRWHYHEQVKKDHVLLANLTHINFTGF